MSFPLRKRKILIYITLSGLLIIITFLVIFSITKNNLQNTPSEELRLGISKSFLSIPVYIAKNQAYFKKEGINIKITEYASGKLATNSMFNDENDISTVADMPVVINSFQRDDFCIIATFTYSYSMVKIVARRDAGIKTAKDLIGKKIGINPGTSSHFYLASFLIFNKIPISDLKLVNIKTVNMPEALQNKKVDAVSIWEPYASKAIKMLKGKAVALKDSDIYRTTFSFATKKQYVKEHQETLIKFLNAIDDAVSFLHKNREESQEIIASVFNIDRNIVNNAWGNFVFGLFLDESLLISWDSIAKWEIENNLTDKKSIPNYFNYICLNTLKQVKPEAITIIH